MWFFVREFDMQSMIKEMLTNQQVNAIIQTFS